MPDAQPAPVLAPGAGVITDTARRRFSIRLIRHTSQRKNIGAIASERTIRGDGPLFFLKSLGAGFDRLESGFGPFPSENFQLLIFQFIGRNKEFA